MTYIEREALLEKLNESKSYLRGIYGEINELDKACCRGELAGVTSAVRKVEAAPAADVAPVVRCGECKNWCCVSESIGAYGCGVFCDSYGRPYLTDPDFFCSYGERRED